VKKNANENVRDFGWEIAHAAVTRRPPIPLSTIVARTHMYTHAANVWGLSLVQGPFSVSPCQTLLHKTVRALRTSLRTMARVTFLASSIWMMSSGSAGSTTAAWFVRLSMSM
jgi:hypothetical protein